MVTSQKLRTNSALWRKMFLSYIRFSLCCTTKVSVRVSHWASFELHVFLQFHLAQCPGTSATNSDCGLCSDTLHWSRPMAIFRCIAYRLSVDGVRRLGFWTKSPVGHLRISIFYVSSFTIAYFPGSLHFMTGLFSLLSFVYPSAPLCLPLVLSLWISYWLSLNPHEKHRIVSAWLFRWS